MEIYKRLPMPNFNQHINLFFYSLRSVIIPKLVIKQKHHIELGISVKSG